MKKSLRTQMTQLGKTTDEVEKHYNKKITLSYFHLENNNILE